MAKIIHVRNVPDWLHEELVGRARRSRRSLTDYVRDLLEREVAQPLAPEVFERIRSRPAVDLGRPAAAMIEEERQGGWR